MRRRPARSLGALASLNLKRLRGSARVRSRVCATRSAQRVSLWTGVKFVLRLTLAINHETLSATLANWLSCADFWSAEPSSLEVRLSP